MITEIISVCKVLGINELKELEQFMQASKAKTDYDLYCELEKVALEQRKEN